MTPSAILSVIGVTSLAGFLAFLVAYYKFPPNLAVQKIEDKMDVNYESRINIKNIGNMPARSIKCDVYDMSMKVGGISLSNVKTDKCGDVISTVASGESFYFPVCPIADLPPGLPLDSCEYVLHCEYHMKLPFVKKRIVKEWNIRLRSDGDKYTWQYLPK